MATSTIGRSRQKELARSRFRIAHVPWLAIVIGLGLSAYFDIQSNTPLVDEFARRWSLQRVVDGYHLVLAGFSPGLPQLLAAAPLAFAHAEPRFWRLTGIPFLFLAAYFTAKIARRFGADEFWSAVGAAALVCAPVTLSLATGIMTETVAIGLYIPAVYFAMTWVSEKKGMGWCVLFTFLAMLQRQQSVVILLGVVLGMLMTRPTRRFARTDVAWFGALLAGTLVAVAIPLAFRSTTNGLNVAPGGGPQSAAVINAIITVQYLPEMLALFALPLGAGLWWRSDREVKGRSRWELLALLVGGIGIALSLVQSFSNLIIFPGLIFTAKGLGTIFIHGNKVPVIPLPIFLAIEVLALLVVALLFARRRRLWAPRVLGVEATLLAVMGFSQVIFPMLTREIADRYYLMAAATLIPVLAAVVSRNDMKPRLSQAWALSALGLMLVFFVAGEQDYIAWENAVDPIANFAYTLAPTNQVWAGYEEEGKHLVLPALEKYGYVDANHRLNKEPRVEVVFVSPDPKYAFGCYKSVASGCLGVMVDHHLVAVPH